MLSMSKIGLVTDAGDVVSAFMKSIPDTQSITWLKYRLRSMHSLFRPEWLPWM